MCVCVCEFKQPRRLYMIISKTVYLSSLMILNDTCIPVQLLSLAWQDLYFIITFDSMLYTKLSGDICNISLHRVSCGRNRIILLAMQVLLYHFLYYRTTISLSYVIAQQTCTCKTPLPGWFYTYKCVICFLCDTTGFCLYLLSGESEYI